MTRARDVSTPTALVLLASQTIGTSVSSVTVTNVFSATYSNYKIFLSGSGVCSSPANLALKLGSSTTGYYLAGYRIEYASSAAVNTTDNGASFTTLGYGNTNILSLSCELIDAGVASFTKLVNGSRVATDAGTSSAGIHQVATAYTDFTITPSAGTITGGTIKVYGYK